MKIYCITKLVSKIRYYYSVILKKNDTYLSGNICNAIKVQKMKKYMITQKQYILAEDNLYRVVEIYGYYLYLKLKQVCKEYYVMLNSLYPMDKLNTFDLSWWEFAAKNKNSEALYRLSLVFQDANKIPSYFKKIKPSALSHYFMKQAAKTNHAQAQYILGMKYKTSDTKLSFAWMKMAANNGHSKAQYQLCKKLQSGHGVTKNPTLALDYAMKAANQGNKDGKEYVLKSFASRKGQMTKMLYEIELLKNQLMHVSKN